MHGQPLPAGLQESDQLPEPVFTPSTKGDVHDVNISFDDAVDLVGAELAGRARDASLELYRRGAELARERGIIIADTKLELGLIDGRSEEHTSELQSLMRISYAVFCLKKKKQHN